MAQVKTDDALLTQGFFKTKFWGKLLRMLSKKLNVTGNGSNLLVTPDGTSTGYDLGSSTTLKAFAQKFKNLVGALKALAFKDKVSDSDISGTISDTHIASASTWSGKQSALPTTGTASTTYAVNISGNAATATTATTAATANSVAWANVSNKATASTGGVYGIVTYTTVLLDEV